MFAGHTINIIKKPNNTNSCSLLLRPGPGERANHWEVPLKPRLNTFFFFSVWSNHTLGCDGSSHLLNLCLKLRILYMYSSHARRLPHVSQHTPEWINSRQSELLTRPTGVSNQGRIVGSARYKETWRGGERNWGRTQVNLNVFKILLLVSTLGAHGNRLYSLCVSVCFCFSHMYKYVHTNTHKRCKMKITFVSCMEESHLN